MCTMWHLMMAMMTTPHVINVIICNIIFSNVSKYFTAHTQLFFLPGIHYFHSNLALQNVSNISLIGGSTANGRHATMQCTGSYHIILRNNNNITIKNLVITKCGFNGTPDIIIAPPPDSKWYAKFTIELHYCSFFTIMNVEIMSRTMYDTLSNVNTIGNSVFHNITSAGMIFTYHDNEAIENATVHVLLDNYQSNLPIKYTVIINLQQTLFAIQLKMIKFNLYNLFDIFIQDGSCSHNVIKINDCTWSGNLFHIKKSDVFFEAYDYKNEKCSHKELMIQFRNYHFINFRQYSELPSITLIKVSSYSGIVNIINCTFINTSNIIPIDILSHLLLDVDVHQNIIVLIKNTSFISNVSPNAPLITVSNRVLLLDGPVLFRGIHHDHQSLIKSSNSIIFFHNYIEVFNCTGVYIFHDVLLLILNQPVTVNITYNNFQLFTTTDDPYMQPLCTF